jgi:hypothetical protein
MTRSNQEDKSSKLKRAIEILEFISSVDDEEIVQYSIESVIEILKEIDKDQ